MKYLFLSIAILAGMGCMTSCANADGAALNPVQWVDPYIGREVTDTPSSV